MSARHALCAAAALCACLGCPPAFAATAADAPVPLAAPAPPPPPVSGAAPALPAIVAPLAQYPAASNGAAASTPGTTGLPDISFSWSGYFKTLAALCFALAVFIGVLWLVKRRMRPPGGSSSPALRVENRLSLGPKQWLLVARYGDRRLVLGVTEKSINLITELYEEAGAAATSRQPRAPAKNRGEANEAGGAAPPGPSFASLLSGKRQTEEQPEQGRQ